MTDAMEDAEADNQAAVDDFQRLREVCTTMLL